MAYNIPDTPSPSRGLSLELELQNLSRLSDASDTHTRMDLHILIIPSTLWRSDLRFAYNSTCIDSISAGFIRVFPDSKLYSVREEIAKQLDFKLLPDTYVFLRAIGKCLTLVSKKQEDILKVKIFLPPLCHDPELFILDRNACHPNNAIPLPPLLSEKPHSKSSNYAPILRQEPPAYPSYRQSFHEYLQSISLKDHSPNSSAYREHKIKSIEDTRRKDSQADASGRKMSRHDAAKAKAAARKAEKQQDQNAQPGSGHKHEESRSRVKPYQILDRSQRMKEKGRSSLASQGNQSSKKSRNSVSFSTPGANLLTDYRGLSLPADPLQEQIGSDERIRLLQLHEEYNDVKNQPGQDERTGLLSVQHPHENEFGSDDRMKLLEYKPNDKNDYDRNDGNYYRYQRPSLSLQGGKSPDLDKTQDDVSQKDELKRALVDPNWSRSDDSMVVNTFKSREEERRLSLEAMKSKMAEESVCRKSLPDISTTKDSGPGKKGVQMRKRAQSLICPPKLVTIIEQRRASTQIWVNSQKQFIDFKEARKAVQDLKEESAKGETVDTVDGDKEGAEGAKDVEVKLEDVEKAGVKDQLDTKEKRVSGQQDIPADAHPEKGVAPAVGVAPGVGIKPLKGVIMKSSEVTEGVKKEGLPSTAEVNEHLSILRTLKTQCKELTDLKNMFSSNLRATHHSIQTQRDNMDKQWKRAYFQERKKGANIEDLVHKAQTNAERAQHLIEKKKSPQRKSSLLKLEKVFTDERMRPSEKANVVRLCQRYHKTIEENKLKLEEMKAKCALEKKVLGAVMVEIKTLRSELLQKKITLSKQTGGRRSSSKASTYHTSKSNSLKLKPL